MRLRDEIESAREALKNEDPEAREQAIGKCSSFLLKESEKIVALQVKPPYKVPSIFEVSTTLVGGNSHKQIGHQ